MMMGFWKLPGKRSAMQCGGVSLRLDTHDLQWQLVNVILSRRGFLGAGDEKLWLRLGGWAGR